MKVALEGACFVAEHGDADPRHVGPLALYPVVGRSEGARDISLRVLVVSPGRTPPIVHENADEVFFVVSGRGRILRQEQPESIGAGTAFHLPPRQKLVIENPGPHDLLLTSACCPDPGPDEHAVMPQAGPATPGLPLVNAAAVPAQRTANRWYKVLLDHRHGSHHVTQFMGAIPPGRAPDHFHEYEEVLYILTGRGRMWAGSKHTPIQRGSCVYLPRRQVHCVENTGPGELRLLGVFYPAGSPAVRYDAE